MRHSGNTYLYATVTTELLRCSSTTVQPGISTAFGPGQLQLLEEP